MPEREYSTAKLVWYVMGVLISIGISVGAYAYVAMREDVSTLNSRTTALEIHDATIDAHYTDLKNQLNRMEEDIRDFKNLAKDLDAFARDMTLEQRARHMYPKQKERVDSADPYGRP